MRTFIGFLLFLYFVFAIATGEIYFGNWSTHARELMVGLLIIGAVFFGGVVLLFSDDD